MNERIKQLAVEAGIISAEYNGFDSTSLATSQKKFAELIVRECIEIAFDEAPSDESACDISQAIKQHFGVEE